MHSIDLEFVHLLFRYVPSQADIAVFEALSGAPAAKFVHALRWYNQIKSYGSEKASLPGKKESADSFGPLAASSKPEAKKDDDGDDDDDFDLFGDDEDDEESERLKAERVAAYEARKAKSK